MNMKRFTGLAPRARPWPWCARPSAKTPSCCPPPCPEGVEVLAMAPESLQQIEKHGSATGPPVPTPAQRGVLPTAPSPRTDGPVEQDVERLAMSTLSFQDYVRERMLKRRRSELNPGRAMAPPPPRRPPGPRAGGPRRPMARPQRRR
jgi:flagellar biosynthesis protein FlhF